MNMQGKNRFVVRENRFTNPQYIEKSFSCIQIKKNFKSIHIPEQLFTNFSKSMGTKKYMLVRDIWNLYKNNSNIIDSYMDADELINEHKKIERLRDIISKNIGEEITKTAVINNIYKFKHKQDKEIQFYFYFDGKVLNLVLIDLFHLGITALKNGKDLSELNYHNNKKNKCCLSNITR